MSPIEAWEKVVVDVDILMEGGGERKGKGREISVVGQDFRTRWFV